MLRTKERYREYLLRFLRETVILWMRSMTENAAYESVKTGLYDGVILDIMMPKMDGLTVLRKVREDGDLVPVLILSAKAEVEDKVNGLDGGADDYLTKPFSSEELLARLRAMSPGPAGCITAAQCGKYHAVPLRVGVGVTFRESLSE